MDYTQWADLMKWQWFYLNLWWWWWDAMGIVLGQSRGICCSQDNWECPSCQNESSLNGSQTREFCPECWGAHLSNDFLPTPILSFKSSSLITDKLGRSAVYFCFWSFGQATNSRICEYTVLFLSSVSQPESHCNFWFCSHTASKHH